MDEKLFYLNIPNMPKVRRSKKAPPEGWELIEPTLDELDAKMREGMFFLTIRVSDNTRNL